MFIHRVSRIELINHDLILFLRHFILLLKKVIFLRQIELKPNHDNK